MTKTVWILIIFFKEINQMFYYKIIKMMIIKIFKICYQNFLQKKKNLNQIYFNQKMKKQFIFFYKL